MSLLADLLARVKQPQSSRDVPPNLKSIVRAAAGETAGKKRIILLSGAFLLSIASGVLAVQFVRSYIDASSSSVPPAPYVMSSAQDRAVPMPDADSGAVSLVTHTENHEEAAPPAAPAANDAVAKATQAAGPAIADEEEKAFAKQWPPKHGVQQAQNNTGAEQLPAETEPVSPETSRQAGLLYAARKAEMNHEYMDALKDYRSALALDPKNHIIMNSMAFLYLRLNLPDEALAYAEKALGQQSDYVPALTNAAIAQARLGDFAGSELNLLRAERLAPDDDAVLLNLAVLRERQKRYDLALSAYQQLKRLGRIEGYVGEARLYELQGDTQTALSLYHTLSSMDSLDQATHTRIRQRIMMLQDTQTGERPSGG